MSFQINLNTVNHSRPVASDTPLPGGAVLNEICGQDYFITLPGDADTAYRASAAAGILSALIDGKASVRISDNQRSFRQWLLDTHIARPCSGSCPQTLVLDDLKTARAVLDILRHPEEVD